MRKIKDLAPTPSAALQAMIDGLKEQSNRPDFYIDMNSFGDYNLRSGYCYGCAATCTIQKIGGKDLYKENIITPISRAHALEFDPEELARFENAIDSARSGSLHNLMVFYYGVKWPVTSMKLLDNSRWKVEGLFLSSMDWKEQLPIVEHLIEKLKSLGL